ncbi:hypothetical protein CXG81DRAFT_25487 [Caulochytrium protostelioides]|uniref:Leo1-domain-containing protein n=1 Tax=Caulochytrium protostelioides TaxID=1555241 RepID=A0A4P9X990_9FUNG|nr:hypothetical protein CXG81DRAFT_25487 [Caulochytrium protostelioides]|eukprot:RKP01855.1 hypothetical protein CXG81DRAFT_25487 [Caulochytrium protostelioides]
MAFSDDDKSLFGSDSEDDGLPAAAPVAATAALPAARAGAADADSDPDAASDRPLAADIADADPARTTHSEMARNVFGSDSESDDADHGAPTATEPSRRDRDRHRDDASDLSDEAELFGDADDLSDDGEKTVAKAEAIVKPVTLTALPKSDPTRSSVYLARLPRLCTAYPAPFDPAVPETYGQAADAAANDPDGADATRAAHPGNLLLWRYVRMPDGSYRQQSNAKIIRWSDGSQSLQVGTVMYQIMTHASHGHQYTVHTHAPPPGAPPGTPPVLETHARVQQTMAFQPPSMDSEAHRALTRAVAEAHQKTVRIKATVTRVDPERAKAAAEKLQSEKARIQRRKAASERSASERHARALAHDGFDDDSDSDRGLGGGAGGGARGSWLRHSGARDAADAEMDGFVVSDDDEEPEAALSDEDEAMDSDEEERARARRLNRMKRGGGPRHAEARRMTAAFSSDEDADAGRKRPAPDDADRPEASHGGGAAAAEGLSVRRVRRAVLSDSE